MERRRERLRRKASRDAEAQSLIKSFTAEVRSDDDNDVDDDVDSRWFWDTLEPCDSHSSGGNRDIFRHTADTPRTVQSTKLPKSRAQRLGVSTDSVEAKRIHDG